MKDGISKLCLNFFKKVREYYTLASFTVYLLLETNKVRYFLIMSLKDFVDIAVCFFNYFGLFQILNLKCFFRFLVMLIHLYSYQLVEQIENWVLLCLFLDRPYHVLNFTLKLLYFFGLKGLAELSCAVLHKEILYHFKMWIFRSA